MATDKPQSTYEEVLAGIGSLDSFSVYGNEILVATYMRPNVTAGGVLLADQTRDEDKWQGKVGIVIKKGPLAFVDAPNAEFKGQNVQPGDLIVYRVSDGFPIDINGVHCRLLGDTEIRMGVTSPHIIY